MTDKTHAHSSPSLTIGDIYHVLFRHKKKILLFWILGAIATAVVWKSQTPPYESHAKLFIRYVVNEAKSPIDQGGPSIQSPGGRGGEGIIASEVEILTSFDLALDVADAMGPAAILPGVPLPERQQAAGVIRGGLIVEAKRGAIVHLRFQHPDRAIAQQVLTQIIATYLKRHAEVHRSAGSLNESLVSQTDQLRIQLNSTEEALRNVQAKAGIVSLEETKRIYAERIERIKEELGKAEEALAERGVVLSDLTNLVSVTMETNLSASVSATNPPAKMSAADMEKYKRATLQLENLRKIEKERLQSFQPGSPILVDIEKQIAENELIKTELEGQYPHLFADELSDSTSNDPLVQALKAKNDSRVLQARIKILNARLSEMQNEIATIGGVEGTIADLQRKRQLQEQYFLSLSASLARAQIEEALAPGRISNISPIQNPTPASKDMSKLQKMILMIAGGAFAGGLALAFAIELYLDRSIRRPSEVEARLKLPLFVSLPRIRLNGQKRKLLSAGPKLLAGSPPAKKENGAEIVPASPATEAAGLATANSMLHPFFDTLRDRLILYFEAQNLTHKPKLVGVTSCASGSGVSTAAQGLAASLSETGDGNVLLVDMNNVERGTAHYFHKGKLECGLDEVLEGRNRDQALVQDNLYVVAENTQDEKLPRILHKRFAALMPKLRASDYDYIIFDLPPVSQISPTTRIAKFMDMVFMVVESEKTDRDVVKRAADMLTATNPRLGVILNKNKTYVPRLLQQEL